MNDITYQSIGIINSPFKTKEDMPIQPTGDKGINGEIKIYSEFSEGLVDLEGFSHIILIYHLHLSTGSSLKVIPFMDNNSHGIFSTRSPKRPNPIGLSVVKLNKIEKNILFIENIDILDGTPLLDIKPFIPDVDCPNVDKLGWLEGKSDKMKNKKSDKRFNE
ncbi:MAG: tRNA (N6-threonylcarbamoyladenosine(37)-N6)-methyltransferase TrmO [Bacteroidales bacterium]|jgi:tRNA-Thr(GGU) m(6)t(6)A37 methyltransferase TsaA|nr:tRNA (N6-threonylcarbamoyladenosine(37)-N6)-methyltransferase TrmO [Bacteroidales bacterium]